MQVLNIHRRSVDRPQAEVATLLATLATKDDCIWPRDQWPAMRLKKGLTVGSAGGHGPIRYTVRQYEPGQFIRFVFTCPKGFKGSHQFEITALTDHTTEIRHTIDMKTSGLDTLSWLLAIRWLHDALIEDAFDKIENQLTGRAKTSRWNTWVRILRKVLSAACLIFLLS